MIAAECNAKKVGFPEKRTGLTQSDGVRFGRAAGWLGGTTAKKREVKQKQEKRKAQRERQISTWSSPRAGGILGWRDVWPMGMFHAAAGQGERWHARVFGGNKS